MAEPFLGEIRMVGFNFAPIGWAQCNGQLLPIAQNTALFALLGTFYGGDGRSTFALPDLRGSVPMNQGQGPGLSERTIGEMGGADTVTLSAAEMPLHTHAALTNGIGPTTANPAEAVWTAVGRSASPPYGPATNLQTMSPQALSVSGSGMPHNNRQPYLVVNFIIALQGEFPSRG
jgi:microcystin-dependent protein